MEKQIDDERVSGALWQKISRKGNEYFSGKITIDGKTTEIILFKIEKRKEKSPFYKIIQSHFVYGNESGQERRDNSKGQNGNENNLWI